MDAQSKVSQQRDVLKAARRLEATQQARDSLLAYMRLTMPDPEDPDDALLSLYETTPQGRLLCQLMEQIEARKLKRVAVSIGPQMGKSQVLSRGAPAWIAGRNPRANMILGSYNQDFASEFGDDVRTILTSNVSRQVFPDFGLRIGGKAKDLLVTDKGGKLAFVGVGGSGTGKPADIFIIDDPIKSDEDAQSAVYRERLWNWYNRTALTRCHGHSAIVIVHTRWHEDDLIGRLCDPDHPERNKKYAGIAERWTYINLPAVVEDPVLAATLGLTLEPQSDPFVVKMFGAKPISSLWPSRKPLEFLAEAKQSDSRAFSALNMGRPTPEEGDYFKAADLILYHNRTELPANLRKYGASDHAASEKTKRDSTVMGCVGIDAADDIWVLPDLFWGQVETDETVTEMLRQFKEHKPLLWWMEDELISKSFGPFLRKAMREKNIYAAIDPVRPAKDKRIRGRSIQGRIQQRRVHFPAFMPWWSDARNQLLKFPNGTHDDFVDFLAHIGMGLEKEVPAAAAKPSNDNVVRTGSIEWILAQTKRRERIEKREKAVAGW